MEDRQKRKILLIPSLIGNRSPIFWSIFIVFYNRNKSNSNFAEWLLEVTKW